MRREHVLTQIGPQYSVPSKAEHTSFTKMSVLSTHNDISIHTQAHNTQGPAIFRYSSRWMYRSSVSGHVSHIRRQTAATAAVAARGADCLLLQFKSLASLTGWNCRTRRYVLQFGWSVLLAEQKKAISFDAGTRGSVSALKTDKAK